MAARDEPQRLAPDIYVSEKTLLELRSYLLPDRLKTLARHLLTETEVQSACAENIEPDERAIKVLTTWNDWKGPRVRDLVREMVLWTQGQCLEKRVWSEFAARRIHPSLIPEDLESLLAQDPPDSLAIPPEPEPQPTQHTITYNILQQNFYAPGQAPGFSERNNAVITDGGTGTALPWGQIEIVYKQNQGPPLPPGNPLSSAPGWQSPLALKPSDRQVNAAATAAQPGEQPAAMATTAPPSVQVDLPPSPSGGEVPQSPEAQATPGGQTMQAPLSGQFIETHAPPSGQHVATTTPSNVPFASFTTPPSAPFAATHASPSGHLVPNREVPSTDPLMAKKTHDLQERLFDSLQRQWKKSITLDWLPGGKSFSLQEYYVGLRWKKKVQRFIQNQQEKLESVYDILKIAEPSERPRATNILIEAPPGMGKTCSMAKLALDWNPFFTESGDSDNPVNKFHYVFLLKLSDVDKPSSLPELIVKQHNKLKDYDKELIKSILEGETMQRVLLLLDGYDEYSPGTNKELDKAIEHAIGKCFLILTSRPGSDSEIKSYIYVSENIRKQMDGEVIIEGFDDDSIKRASTKYLESEEKSAAMLKQAEEAGIYELLKVPIILLFVCLIYSEEEGLPRTKTKIYSEVFAKIMERGIMKTGTLKRKKLDSLLVGLGKLAWKALQNNIKQLLLRKDEVGIKHPDILKLGLLFEVGVERVFLDRQPTYVSFQHKSLQEFAAAKYITHRLQKKRKMKKLWRRSTKSTMKEFFPHWHSIDSDKEVLAFCAGLLDDPRPLVEYVSDKYVDMNEIHPIILKSISRESQTKHLLRDVVLRIIKPLKFLNIVGSTTGLLTEVLPRDDTPLHSLETLNLDSAELNNSDIKHFGSLIRDNKLPSLRQLNLSRNSLSGSLPELLPLCDGIQSLELLNLSDTGLNETDVHHLAFIVQDTKIESIDLYNTTLTGLFLEFKLCTHAKNLRQLVLHDASLSRSDVQHLGGLILDKKLPALRQLDLSRNSLSGSLPELLPLCDTIRSLELLNLSDTGLNELDVHHLAFIVHNTKIMFIELSNNILTGLVEKFQLCSPAQTIMYLTLSETKLNKTDIKYLTGLIRDNKLPELFSLELDGNNLCDIMGECGELIKACAAHRGLNLFLRNNRFSYEFWTKWQQHSAGIQGLSLIF